METISCDKCGHKTIVLGNVSYNIGLVLCKDCKEELDELKKLDHENYLIEIKELGGKDKTNIVKQSNSFLDKLKKIQGRS